MFILKSQNEPKFVYRPDPLQEHTALT